MAVMGYIDEWDINGEQYEIHDKERGLPNGVATLDSNGRIPLIQNTEDIVLNTVEVGSKAELLTTIPTSIATTPGTDLSRVNGLWFARQQSNSSYTARTATKWSIDLQTWEACTDSYDNSSAIIDVFCYDTQNSLYIGQLRVLIPNQGAPGYSTRYYMAYSTDGKIWNRVSGLSTSYEFKYLGYKNGRTIICTSYYDTTNRGIFYSLDGTTYTHAPNPSDSSFLSLYCFDDNTNRVFVGKIDLSSSVLTYTLYVSTDLSAWSTYYTSSLSYEDSGYSWDMCICRKKLVVYIANLEFRAFDLTTDTSTTLSKLALPTFTITGTGTGIIKLFKSEDDKFLYIVGLVSGEVSIYLIGAGKISGQSSYYISASSFRVFNRALIKAPKGYIDPFTLTFSRDGISNWKNIYIDYSEISVSVGLSSCLDNEDVSGTSSAEKRVFVLDNEVYFTLGLGYNVSHIWKSSIEICLK